MAQWLPPVGIAFIVFVSTNVDNMLVLLTLFADVQMKARAVAAGYIAGMSIIVFGSAVSAIAAQAIPRGYIALLGIAPLAIGLRRLRDILRDRSYGAAEQAASEAKGVLEAEHRLEQRTRSHMLGVALITVANGGDNFGVYVPLFARAQGDAPMYLLLFALLTAASCLGGYAFANSRLAGRTVQTLGHVILPFLLIGIGLWTLGSLRVLLQ